MAKTHRMHHGKSIAREEIAAAYDRYTEWVVAAGARSKRSMFCRSYNEGGQRIPAWVQELYPKLTPEILNRAVALVETPAEAKDAARREIVTAYSTYEERVRKMEGQPYKEMFVERYNAGLEMVPNWARRVYPTLHVSTVYNWFARIAAKGEGGLSSGFGNRLGTGFFDRNKQVLALAERLFNATPAIEADSMLDALTAGFPAITIPSKSTIQRLLQRLRSRA